MKIEFWIMSINFKYFDTYKSNYNSENLNEIDEKPFDFNQFKILGKKKQRSKSTEENNDRESTEDNTEKDANTMVIWNKWKRIWRINKRNVQWSE